MPFRVFISYAHEGSGHRQWVEELAAHLRKNGVDASLDIWDLLPGQDIASFMESEIRNSDFVIIICTPEYARRSNCPVGGVGYEKNIISAEMLQAQDLRPKFIPVIKDGSPETSLPNYIGTRFAIDFTDNARYPEALRELLRTIYSQPHPRKPTLGQAPILEPMNLDWDNTGPLKRSHATATEPYEPDIDVWEREARGRFDFLCTGKLTKGNPFEKGFWQGSFVLIERPEDRSLMDFLDVLRASPTNRTGWDVGWVPTREAIAPYPYKGGIEVWLAEEGDRDPATSDFWRAEPSGRFSLFRGYQEDSSEYPSRRESRGVTDFQLVLWRVAELLLYLESFCAKIGSKDSGAFVKITWNGLTGRRIGTHGDEDFIYDRFQQHVCHQESVSSKYRITGCGRVRKELVSHVHIITRPLFEAYDFFVLTEEQIKDHIRRLFDADKESK